MYRSRITRGGGSRAREGREGGGGQHRSRESLRRQTDSSNKYRLNKAPELQAANAAKAARFQALAEQRAALRAAREEAAAAQGYAAAAAPASPPDAALTTPGVPPAAGGPARGRKRKRSAEEQAAEAAAGFLRAAVPAALPATPAAGAQAAPAGATPPTETAALLPRFRARAPPPAGSGAASLKTQQRVVAELAAMLDTQLVVTCAARRVDADAVRGGLVAILAGPAPRLECESAVDSAIVEAVRDALGHVRDDRGEAATMLYRSLLTCCVTAEQQVSLAAVGRRLNVSYRPLAAAVERRTAWDEDGWETPLAAPAANGGIRRTLSMKAIVVRTATSAHCFACVLTTEHPARTYVDHSGFLGQELIRVTG